MTQQHTVTPFQEDIMDKKIEAFRLTMDTTDGKRTVYFATYSAAYQFAVDNVRMIVGDFSIARA